MYCTSARRTLLPWKIAECPLPTFTFKQFYEEKVVSEFSDRVLKQDFVGQTKESLDLVDHDLVVAEVLSVFGRYVVKYNVEKEAGSEPPQVVTYTSYMYKVSEKYELRMKNADIMIQCEAVSYTHLTLPTICSV